MIREQIAETIKNEAYCGYEGKLLGRRDAANAILTLLCTEIEKMENPYPVSQRFVSSAGNLWEECRQAILDKLKEGAE